MAEESCPSSSWPEKEQVITNLWELVLQYPVSSTIELIKKEGTPGLEAELDLGYKKMKVVNIQYSSYIVK